MQASPGRSEKTMHVIAHTLHCWEPGGLWNMQQRAFGSWAEQSGRSCEFYVPAGYWFALHWQLLSLCGTTTTFPCQLKHSAGARDGSCVNASGRILQVHTSSRSSLLPKQERRGRDRWRNVKHRPATSTGLCSLAYSHAWFTSITLPQCETLHLFSKC